VLILAAMNAKAFKLKFAGYVSSYAIFDIK